MTTGRVFGNSPPAPADPSDVGMLLRSAVSLHQAGRLAEAEDLYRRILAAQPRHFDSLHLLGVILHQRGEYAAAVRQIDAAIGINPDIAQAHNNRGVALQALGRREDALASFDAALALVPDYFDALRNRADTLSYLNRFEDAVQSYDRAISLKGDVAELFIERGHALMALSRLEQAVDSYERGIARDPSNRDAHLNRGIAFARLGRFDQAIAAYDDAIAVSPNDAEALNNRGAALRSLRRFPEALASCDRAIELDPALAAAFNNRGMALRDMNRLEEAIASYDAAIGLAPQFGEAHGNRANALVLLDRCDEAIASYQRALAVNPDDTTARGNLANALVRVRRFDEAFACYQQALAINPDDATARCALGMAKLLIGRFEDGWKDYEARLNIGQMASRRRGLPQPQWTGDAEIGGKRLLLLAEQGLGDTIMAVRYVRQAVDRGAVVMLEVPATLRALLGSVGNVDRIVIEGDPRPDFDLYCPLLSLPGAFNTRLETIPAQVPYLSASPSHIAAWRERLAPLRGLRVGLVWAGNPQHNNDARRSVGLQALLPVLGETDVGFISLQKDLRPGDAELLRLYPRLTHLGGELASYDDTAAVISLLDLVISVDTSVAHVAGALGKPVWILLPSNPDWRWLLDRDDSPWYPTARLFRQSVGRGWSEVIERVRVEVGALAGSARPADCHV
jgi:tetratricopeptide (TPR) repeat protein